MSAENDLLSQVNQNDSDIDQDTFDAANWDSYVSENKESWDAFIKYVVEGVSPDWLNEEFLSQDQKAEIIQLLESLPSSSELPTNMTFSDELAKQFVSFVELKAGVELSGFSNEIDFDTSVPEFDLSTLQENFVEETDLLEKMGTSFEQDLDSSSDLNLNYEELGEEKLFDESDLAKDSSFKIDLEEETEAIESPSDEIEENELKSKQDNLRDLEAQQALMQQNGHVAPTQSSNGLAALGSMVGSLMKSGAHIAKGVENMTAPIATWGIEKTKKITEDLAVGTNLVNQSVNNLASMNEEQMAAHNQQFREGQFASNISSIADVMGQVREMMADLNQPTPNSPLSLMEMNQQVKTAENPKMAEFFKGQIKEALLEKGAESIFETTDALIHANSLIEKYLDNGQAMAEKIGENLETNLGSEFEAYQAELQEGEEIISEIASMAEELEVLNPEQALEVKEAIETLKDSIAALIKNIKELFSGQTQDANVSGPVLKM